MSAQEDHLDQEADESSLEQNFGNINQCKGGEI